jgi:hypothetical protein
MVIFKISMGLEVVIGYRKWVKVGLFE